MQFICSKIDEAECSSRCEHGAVFLLECMLTLCSSLPQIVHCNKHLTTFLWQKFCPSLISVLGTPRVDKNIVTRSGSVEEEKGRGSGCLGTAPSFSSLHAKTVYSISIELVRLVGMVASLRPVLESVFHRVLLYPAPEYRSDAVRAATELLGNPNRLLDIAGPLNQPEDGSSLCDMSLIRLIMDSLEECSGSRSASMNASVSCCLALLKALEELCLGRCVPTGMADKIHNLFPSLTDCDYKGPRTYQSMNRLPKQYRERIQQENVLQTVDYDSDSSSGIGRRGSGSEWSGDTEGPEEDSDDEDVEDCKIDAEYRSRITRTLGLEAKDMPITLGDSERQHARHFIGALHGLLPALAPMRSCIQVDQALQNFASQYCQGVVSEQPPTEWGIIVNADGIYLATYAALLLDLGLSRSNYYSSSTKQISVTEEDFVNEVQNSGVVVYLSGAWLRELYQAVVSSSLLQTHGYLPTNYNSQQHALINLLTDIEGTGTCLQGSQMLWECRRLERASFTADSSTEAEAGLRLSRKILTCCWDSVLKVLATPLTEERHRSKGLKLRNLKFVSSVNRQKEAKETVANSLEGLQTAANLCNKLGLQDRCGSILELLASASCPMKREKKIQSLLRPHNVNGGAERLTTSHALNMELLLGSGLELGSHCSSCWPHVFRCCVYLKELEHDYFSRSENRALGSTTKVTRKEEKAKVETDQETSANLDEDTCVDVYSFLCSSGVPQTVSEIITARGNDRFSTDLLDPQETAKIICILSQLVDKLFEDAAMKLNLKSLESFSRCLCAASQSQLFPPVVKQSGSKRNWWLKFMSEKGIIADHLLLDSVGEIMLKCVRSGRPLIHIMRIWAIVCPYLMESACHKDLTISRKAVKHIHDTINACLNEHSELPHFHVNEALFKPFENLLCLELCDSDVQDRIVGCLCEFVEANYTEIRSGWRPLFGALRVVSADTSLDIFKTFLETDNALVFSNAAIDCILCLLKQIRAHEDASSQNMNHCMSSLSYIRRCESILGSIYRMPQCLVFHSAHRIQVSDGLLIDPNIPDLELVRLETVPDDVDIESTVSYAALSVSPVAGPSLDAIDRPSGVLRVWFLLLEGMHSAAIAAPASLQPCVLDMLFTDLAELIAHPGPEFGLFCINRLILPMTQSWLRQMSKVQDGDYSGLKQSIGLLSDLVVKYFEQVTNKEHIQPLMNLMLTQIMLLLAECCVHPIDAVARLGPACFRHILNSAGIYFTEDQWNIAVLALHRACDVTLTPIRQLVMAFSSGSQSFYGDANQIKVAARRDTTIRELIHLKQLSQQVFLLDGQRDEVLASQEKEILDERSYTFLVTVPGDEIVRVPMKTLVIALLSHQSLLQIVAGVLLRDTRHVVPSLANVLLVSSPTSTEERHISPKSSLPGFMGLMRSDNIDILLNCLDLAYRTSLLFDSRLGLKFLIQKVAGLERAANLYRQAGAAWTIKAVVLFEICLAYVEDKKLSVDDIKQLLEKTDGDENDDGKFLKKLRQNFNDLCSTYIDVILEAEGSQDSLEKADQPIFFLIACQDEEIPEVKKSSKASEGEVEASEDAPKPFYLSDFTKVDDDTSNYESDPEECKDKGGEEDGECREEEENACKEKQNNDEGEEESDKELEKPENIDEVLNEFKKSKKKHLEASKQPRLNPFNVPKPPQPSVPPEIEIQRRKSFIKDGEAHRKVWSEMLSVVFDLLAQLDDDQFRLLLPIVFDGVRRLTAHATDAALKQAVAELFQRVALVFGFGSC
ncbi:UNVERIFIED_CONTAM: hypothetical protein PYX00_003074 [Menopon gallinae]|uniref:SEC7 domain-containing protein n=1 Tax=Menopon gallinae TaxID=328185 RepID=A0AAW2HYJ7_9NEOP